jgi:hypothetical protein
LDKLNKFIYKISIKSAANSSLPKVRARKITSLPPEIIKFIKEKRKLCRVYAQSHDENVKKELTAIKNKIKRMIKEVRNRQWSEFIQSIGPNPISTKPFWKRIKRFRNAPVTNSIPTIKDGGIEYKTEIINLIKEKRKLCLIYAQTHDQDIKKELTAIRNRIKRMIKEVRNKQSSDFIQSVGPIQIKSQQNPFGIRINRFRKKCSYNKLNTNNQI